jgi:hypothetical protein
MATIGPSIHDVDILVPLLEAGMVAGRVDLTWGKYPRSRPKDGMQQLAPSPAPLSCGACCVLQGPWTSTGTAC